MNVAIIADPGNQDGTRGGAELTMAEFAEQAPDDVTLTELDDAETVVIGNCVHVDPAILEKLTGKRVVRYHNDLARSEHPALREWLDRNAIHVFTSPYHQKLYGLDGEWPNIPPALDLDAFRHGTKGEGAVAIAPWQNPGKGQVALHEWSLENEPVDVYGPGAFQPQGPRLFARGTLAPEDVAATLRKYGTFVHLPTAPEPFGRTVVEAWASGLRIVTNGCVGALYWIKTNPEGLETAGEDFWGLVCG